jgi:hypothetical protein
MSEVPPDTATIPEDVHRALLERLRQPAGVRGRQADGMRALIERLEQQSPADLARDASLLRGVWELRWSSSALPYLAVGPWLENLQLLDPERGRGMNLLRLAGPLAPLAGIAVQAAIAIDPGEESAPTPRQRVTVRFERGGWLGPRFGDTRLQLLREVRQSFPAWLDITVLDQELRVCRGNAGTLFALLRRSDLAVEEFLPS